MSSPRWTKEQQQVIDSRKGNLLVAAAAGSGKTAVLVQRIINMITDPINPIDIDKLLVVTFTNAAATEMKERVQNAIETLLEKDSTNTRLKNQLLLLEKANITTIHSFCLNVIKEYFYKLELSSDFKIGEEQELALLKIRTMDEVFEELYKESHTEFETLVDQFGSTRGDNNLRESMLSMYHFVISSPNPKKWLEKSTKDFNIDDNFDFLKTPAGKILIETIKIEFTGILQSLELIIEQTDGILDLKQYNTKYLNELNELNKVFNKLDSDWDSIKTALESVKFEDYRTGMKRLPKGTEEYIKELQKGTKKTRDKCKDDVTSLKNEIFFREESEIKLEYEKLYTISKAISEILSRFIDKYRDIKMSKNIIDFNDIEHFAIQILTNEVNGEIIPSEIANIYSEKFEEIFIDEYQDSNLTQELILTSISKNNSNRFMVGDLKQSIYKFRQARPEIFLEKYNKYSTDLTQQDKKILLHKNFRSRGEVLDATNFIFEHIMRAEIGGLEYTKDERLNLGGNFKVNTENNVITGGPAELHIISGTKNSPKIDDLGSNTEEEELDKIQQEAKVIGNIIKDLVTTNESGEVFKVIDKRTGEYRNVNFGDIVILLRSTANWQETITTELEKLGIPVATSSNSGYLNSFEIKTSLAIMKAISNPYEDISFVGALRTNCFNFTEDDLTELKNSEYNLCFYELIREYSQNNNDLGIKCKNTFEKINEFINFSKNHSIYDTLNFIFSSTNYYTFISALPNGDVRRNNLELLLERSVIFAKDNNESIDYFIEYIEELSKNELDLEGHSITSEQGNAINIMTIHKSKGLEFPVVICAGMGKQFNTMDLKNPLLYHIDLGYGPQIIDTTRKISYSSIKKEALKRKMHIETLAEEIRILYVALTRPKEKLIITGMVNDLQSSMEKWSNYLHEENKLPAYAVLKASTYLDWIIPTVLKHNSFKDLCLEYGIEDVSITKHSSKWDYRIWEVNNIPDFTLKTGNAIQDTQINHNEELDIILRGFNNESDLDTSCKKTIKSFSITDFLEISKSQQNTYEDLLLPDITKEESTFSATDIGNIVHEVMQKIDFININSKTDLHNEIDRLVKEGLLLEAESNILNRDRIWDFISSDLGKRIKDSKSFKREQPISLYIDDSVDIDNINDMDSIIINGIIDIYFEEEDGLVIIDYKTDYVDDKNIDNILQEYHIQLRLYKEALERITNKKVKECYLHLFSKQESFKII